MNEDIAEEITEKLVSLGLSSYVAEIKHELERGWFVVLKVKNPEIERMLNRAGVKVF